MKRLTEKTQIRKFLRPIVWDYQIDPYELFEVATGKKERAGSFTREKALIRMIEYLGWYDLLRLFGLSELSELLTRDVISGLRPAELQEKYEFVRKILQGETVSFSGWSPEYRKKTEHTLLSDRWYRSR
ncbi:hypothetical protein QUF72_18750 [Desulfobacterales bacterium HSG2]|nr:hypothetical protein [Desulfobacterales bacterium HSG2]